MDEVAFGPSREPRLPSRRPRVLAAIAAAGVAAAAVAFALQANGAHPAVTTRPAATQDATQSLALPDPALLLPPAGCQPVQAHWPDLAALPAGMRAAALPVIVAAQFSGRCPAP
jgi:hypothetical protein